MSTTTKTKYEPSCICCGKPAMPGNSLCILCEKRMRYLSPDFQTTLFNEKTANISIQIHITQKT